LLVAFYASARDKLDIDSWNYGYTWRGWPRERVDVREYTQGTVIIDVVDPGSRTLLWRGQGVAQVSDDPDDYIEQLEKVVNQTVRRFPEATAATVSGR
jgi:Domain of unknown function (DUF4136)